MTPAAFEFTELPGSHISERMAPRIEVTFDPDTNLVEIATGDDFEMQSVSLPPTEVSRLIAWLETVQW